MSKFLIAGFLFLFIISGCSSSSSVFSERAKQLGFHAMQIQGSNFKHTLYENNKLKKGLLHVYLGGDGTPWFEGRYITEDPTPQNLIMLNLMKQDKEQSIYLGRPCYHQKIMPPNCKKPLWTNKRYSRTVVNSMVTALSRYNQKYDIKEVRLFGFSGGGTLAMLLAPRLHGITTVVTLAGNLDTDAWTKYHGYLPLIGSLNPANEPPLPSNIQQYHLVASLDKNIPSFIVKPVVKRQKNTWFTLLNNANHNCCWGKVWPKILSKFD